MNNFPNLSGAKLIGYDLETFDPYLMEDGPGWARGVGYVLGVSLAVDRNHSWYIPVGERPDPQVIAYLNDTLGTEIPKTGANLQYDMGWLSEIGVWPKGLQMDVQFAEPLLDDVMLDEYGKRRSFSLDALAMHYLGRKKEKSEIEAYCQGKWPYAKDFRENLWRCPPELVAEYAKADAWLPIEIIKQQWLALQREELTELFKLECRLLPLLVKMRRRGMPINETRALEAREEMLLIERLTTKMISDEVGFKVNVNSSKDLARVFDAYKVPYAKTAKGNPSFTADSLSVCSHPIARSILDLRKTIKARSTFIENAILGKSINGKVYPSLHPLRTDEGGTISGRFSCSQPNGQQIPKRDTERAPLIRGMFCPEEGYPSWACMDLSQIEYRFFAHYSGDLELIAAYADPNTDYHSVVSDILGGQLPRGVVKNFNFMMLYGGGKAKLAAMLRSQLTPEEAENLYNAL
jgi:DNA polymerase-1